MILVVVDIFSSSVFALWLSYRKQIGSPTTWPPGVGAAFMFHDRTRATCCCSHVVLTVWCFVQVLYVWQPCSNNCNVGALDLIVPVTLIHGPSSLPSTILPVLPIIAQGASPHARDEGVSSHGHEHEAVWSLSPCRQCSKQTIFDRHCHVFQEGHHQRCGWSRWVSADQLLLPKPQRCYYAIATCSAAKSNQKHGFGKALLQDIMLTRRNLQCRYGRYVASTLFVRWPLQICVFFWHSFR